MGYEQIAECIHELENSLLQTEVRQSADKINEILSEDFFEYCSSGKIYQYKKGDIISKDIAGDLPWAIKDFSISILAEDIVLASYKLIKYDRPEKEGKYSLRSSIWKRSNEKWKMIFHQGTITEEFK